MKLISVVGARPQFIKLAPIEREVVRRAGAGASLTHEVIHTGQHYDSAMSAVFFRDLELSPPVADLKVGSGSHAQQTARMLTGLEAVLLEKGPDAVLVYGDTNSTLAGALVATKLGLRTAHVEAGLRSFDRGMPEELNRVATDHLCDLLLAPTDTALGNLEREGLARRSRLVGDLMLDGLIHTLEAARRDSGILERLGLQDTDYAVATLHRAGNTEAAVLARLLEGLNRVAEGMAVVLPMHPRTRAILGGFGVDWAPAAGLHITEPLSHIDMLRLVDGSAVVVTDSGGLQKEAFIIGRPCVTLRTETEWTETVEAGANVLVGAEPDRICAAVKDWRDDGWGRCRELGQKAHLLYGEGRAARRILDAVTSS